MATVTEVLSNYRALAKQVRQMPARLRSALARTLDEENNRTLVALTIGRMGFSSAGPVQANGLRRISSTAVRSLRATKAEIQGDDITASLGTNLRYVQAHEFGFVGEVFVQAHNRRIFKYGKARLVRFTNPVTGEGGQFTRRSRRVARDSGGNARGTTVRAHQMHMNLPARHMIRDTLAERVPAYNASFGKTMVATYDAVLGEARNARLEPMTGGLGV